jgi:hypothetical protein
VGLAGLLLEVQYLPHYAAPMTGIFLAFIVQATRFGYVCGRRGKARVLFAMRAVPLICLFSLLFATVQLSLGSNIVTDLPHSWYSILIGNTQRAGILKWLEQQPGQHVVIVRYAPRHTVHNEWVYNPSDIDAAKVIWARDMDPDHNQELIRYFPNRTVWLVEPDKRVNGKVQIVPYPASVTMLQPATAKPDSSGLF